MTFGVLHADNFMQANWKYRYWYFLAVELNGMDPLFGQSQIDLYNIQDYMQPKYELMKGWERNGISGMARNDIV